MQHSDACSLLHSSPAEGPSTDHASVGIATQQQSEEAGVQTRSSSSSKQTRLAVAGPAEVSSAPPDADAAAGCETPCHLRSAGLQAAAGYIFPTSDDKFSESADAMHTSGGALPHKADETAAADSNAETSDADAKSADLLAVSDFAAAAMLNAAIISAIAPTESTTLTMQPAGAVIVSIAATAESADRRQSEPEVAAAESSDSSNASVVASSLSVYGPLQAAGSLAEPAGTAIQLNAVSVELTAIAVQSHVVSVQPVATAVPSHVVSVEPVGTAVQSGSVTSVATAIQSDTLSLEPIATAVQSDIVSLEPVDTAVQSDNVSVSVVASPVDTSAVSTETADKGQQAADLLLRAPAKDVKAEVASAAASGPSSTAPCGISGGSADLGQQAAIEAAGEEAWSADDKALSCTKKAESADKEEWSDSKEADSGNQRADSADAEARSASEEADSANEKAESVNDEAQSADEKIWSADEKATSADREAESADEQAQPADTVAELADEEAQTLDEKAQSAAEQAQSANQVAETADKGTELIGSFAQDALCQAEASSGNTAILLLLEHVLSESADPLREAAEAAINSDAKVNAADVNAPVSAAGIATPGAVTGTSDPAMFVRVDGTDPTDEVKFANGTVTNPPAVQPDTAGANTGSASAFTDVPDGVTDSVKPGQKSTASLVVPISIVRNSAHALAGSAQMIYEPQNAVLPWAPVNSDPGCAFAESANVDTASAAARRDSVKIFNSSANDVTGLVADSGSAEASAQSDENSMRQVSSTVQPGNVDLTSAEALTSADELLARAADACAHAAEEGAGTAAVHAQAAEEDAGPVPINIRAAEEDAGTLIVNAHAPEEDAGTVNVSAQAAEGNAGTMPVSHATQDARTALVSAQAAKDDAGPVTINAYAADEGAGTVNVSALAAEASRQGEETATRPAAASALPADFNTSSSEAFVQATASGRRLATATEWSTGKTQHAQTAQPQPSCAALRAVSQSALAARAVRMARQEQPTELAAPRRQAQDQAQSLPVCASAVAAAAASYQRRAVVNAERPATFGNMAGDCHAAHHATAIHGCSKDDALREFGDVPHLLKSGSNLIIP